MKSENPNVETRNKFEIRMTKWFRFGFRASCFGFPASGAAPTGATILLLTCGLPLFMKESDMPVTEQRVSQVCRTLLGLDAGQKKLPLDQYLAAIPSLESLGDLPSGTPVLIRGDVDAKPGEKIGEGDVRLRSMVETLEFG